MGGTPLRFLWDFSKRIKHQHLTFSVDVRLSLARILRQVQWWSVSMVTRYDVISSSWSSHFEWKCVFFQLFSTIKVNLVAEIMQSAYFCVIIHVKQLPLLMTSHASSSATINKIYLILLRRSKAFQWRQNRFEILQHIKNSGEGFYLPPPSHVNRPYVSLHKYARHIVSTTSLSCKVWLNLWNLWPLRSWNAKVISKLTNNGLWSNIL